VTNEPILSVLAETRDQIGHTVLELRRVDPSKTLGETLRALAEADKAIADLMRMLEMNA
jgi:hypothetical protein